MNRLEQFDIQFASDAQAKLPDKVTLQGRYARLEPLNTEKHHRSLYQNFLATPDAFEWLFVPEIKTIEDFKAYCMSREQNPRLTTFVISKIGQPDDFIGINGLSEPVTKHKKITLELGLYSSKLQSTAASTESYYLLMRYAFGELGFQRISVKDILPQNQRATRTV